MKRNRFFIVALLVSWVTLLTVHRVAAEDVAGRIIDDRWYVMLLGEDRVGHMRVWVTKSDDRYISQTQMRMRIGRGNSVIDIGQSTKFEELADGVPVRAGATTRMGQMDTVQVAVFQEDGIEWITRQAGTERTQQLPPIEGDWMTPMAMERYVIEQLKAGAETIHLRTFDVSVGPQPFAMTRKVIGEENVEVFGRIVPAIVWDVTMSYAPDVVMREYADERGRVVKGVMDMGPEMRISILEADRELALAEFDPPEMLADSLIEPNQPIRNPRRTRHGVFRLTLKDDQPFENVHLPRVGYQRVMWADDRTAMVVINFDEPVNPEEDLPTPADRQASMMIDSQDPKIIELTQQALGDDADELSTTVKAEKLRQFVYRYIHAKDLSVGMGTASEVARTRQGDCTEHGVLLAAMLRAADIPARTASGLIYADRFAGRRNVFGYHLWTQAWIVEDTGGRWVDLDATLPPATPFDATHITLSISSMADDEMANDVVQMLPLMGRLQIEVLQAE